jgi:tripartite-type tricarboxylate transporter receptor subunit TctC
LSIRHLWLAQFKSTPEQFATLVREDLPRWARIVKESGATID